MPAMLAGVVRVHIDEARHDRATAQIDDGVSRCEVAGADARDARALHQYGATLDHGVRAERDDPRVRQCNRALRRTTRDGERDRRRIANLAVDAIRVVALATTELDGDGVAPAREQPTGPAQRLHGEATTALVDGHRVAAGPVPGERGHIHVVTRLERDPATVR